VNSAADELGHCVLQTSMQVAADGAIANAVLFCGVVNALDLLVSGLEN
jgi:hypothetical protein